LVNLQSSLLWGGIVQCVVFLYFWSNECIGMTHSQEKVNDLCLVCLFALSVLFALGLVCFISVIFSVALSQYGVSALAVFALGRQIAC
jgi:hypothetical protein